MTEKVRDQAVADQWRAALIELLGAARVIEPGKRISRYLRDFSWFSPILDNELSDTTVEAVALPRSVEDLRDIVALAARLRMPITMRGAGTGNYGQSLPLAPGVVVDVRGVAGVLEVGQGSIAVLPGTVMKDVEESAKTTGQELSVMPSTFRVATAAGFISGGSGGLGASANGDLWSGNVLAVELLTVEEEPRLVRLEGREVDSVLHVYGTVGVITRVEFALVEAHQYDEWIVEFSHFRDALGFAWDAVSSRDIHARLISAHQAPLGSTMTPIAESLRVDSHVVLGWVAREDRDAFLSLARSAGSSRTQPWPDNAKDVTQLVYSHSILWTRRAFEGSSWLQCEYAPDDREALIAQAGLIDERYDGVFLQHIELIASPLGGVRGIGVPALVGLPDHDEALEALLAYCRGIGIKVLNPHSFVVDEGGFVGDTSRMLALKAKSDPHGILNPGKLGASFFARRSAVRDGAEQVVLAPEELTA